MGTMDPTTAIFGIVVALLAITTMIVQFLKGQPESGLNPAAIAAFNGRLRSWWMMCCVLAAAFWFERYITVSLFGFLSFWALREFITLTPTRRK